MRIIIGRFDIHRREKMLNVKSFILILGIFEKKKKRRTHRNVRIAILDNRQDSCSSININ
jgi:hypothetical protein